MNAKDAKAVQVTLALTADQMADLWRIVDQAATAEFGREVDLKQVGKLKAAAVACRVGKRYLAILDAIEDQASAEIKAAIER